MDDALIESAEAARILGVSVRTWHKMVQRGQAPPPARKIQKKILTIRFYDRSTVEAFKAGKTKVVDETAGLISSPAAAAIVGCSASWFLRLSAAGSMPAPALKTKIGGRTMFYYRPEDIEPYRNYDFTARARRVYEEALDARRKPLVEPPSTYLKSQEAADRCGLSAAAFLRKADEYRETFQGRRLRKYHAFFWSPELVDELRVRFAGEPVRGVEFTGTVRRLRQSCQRVPVEWERYPVVLLRLQERAAQHLGLSLKKYQGYETGGRELPMDLFVRMLSLPPVDMGKVKKWALMG